VDSPHRDFGVPLTTPSAPGARLAEPLDSALTLDPLVGINLPARYISTRGICSVATAFMAVVPDRVGLNRHLGRGSAVRLRRQHRQGSSTSKLRGLYCRGPTASAVLSNGAPDPVDDGQNPPGPIKGQL
jgi:hypothetical protein